MPAVSKSQQRFMGIVHAIQKGDMPASEAHGPAREAAKEMKPEDAKDFASTKLKGLPEHKTKSSYVLSAGDRLLMANSLANAIQL
jgi:Protein of unknwon function (DUF3008)